ncbi:MAG: hypothetical protein CMJ85_13665 [Planctomycetes bacterium]|jgi:prepilin-type N-terminal cleavage/methylation domain-containing protein|nr:hypothetical protein [Planctomycetota bacterium]
MKSEHCQNGFTMVEMIVVSAIMIILVGAIGGMAVSSRSAQDFVERQTLLTGATQDLMSRIRSDVASSVRLFGDDSEGAGYLLGLDRGPWSGLTGERLPKIESAGAFSKDDEPASAKTGNVLLFAMHDRTDTWDLAQDPETPKYIRIDLYRIVAYYLRKTPLAKLGQEVDGLDLVRWVSQPLIDGHQIEAVTDPAERAPLLAHLYIGSNPQNSTLPYPPANLTWKPGAVFSGAFQDVLPAGDMQPVDPTFKLPVDRRLARADHLEYRRLSIATNVAGPNRGLGRFGLVDNALDGFPHGFEVQVVGPAAARQVLAHLSVVSVGHGSNRAWLDLAGVVETRDL